MLDTSESGAPVPLPADARLVVPVMAATGGSGRSTLACLLAAELAEAGGTVVLDLAVRSLSPWPAWAPSGGGGLAALPPHLPHSRAQIRTAAARRGPVDVLTDGRAWHAPPLCLPVDPAAWYQLGAAGGWQLVVADTAYPVTHDLLTARCAAGRGLTGVWCELPFAVPVLCAAATAEGVRALQQAVAAMAAAGLPLRRTVAVLVAVDRGRDPAAVRSAADALADRLYDVQALPHDPHIRARGLAEVIRPRSRTRRAAARIAEAVLEAARATWGEELPAAPLPAPVAAGYRGAPRSGGRWCSGQASGRDSGEDPAVASGRDRG
ncbi:hypothetical protein [Streptomyces bambusae]|uniref:ParA family protein n=1 Tax=Streptomyces bambusae TaxID=1550616 RepID=A0ABS6Z948_9ACTN|nr:hypothetical protein [Streptomyces bambusae]MBW5484285.1 hypothetical protein [Streptomyces bambusae]